MQGSARARRGAVREAVRSVQRSELHWSPPRAEDRCWDLEPQRPGLRLAWLARGRVVELPDVELPLVRLGVRSEVGPAERLCESAANCCLCRCRSILLPVSHGGAQEEV